MNEEELMEYVDKFKHLSNKKFKQKLDELKAQGIDYSYMICKHAITHTEEYDYGKVTVSFVEYSKLVVALKDSQEKNDRILEELQKILQKIDESIARDKQLAAAINR